jgi:signal transduction histidine kinase
MSLRTQILIYVVAVMAIMFVLVAAALVPDRLLAERKFAFDLGRDAVQAMQAVLEPLTRAQREALFAARPALFNDDNIVDAWILADESGAVLSAKYTREIPQPLTDGFLRGRGFDEAKHFKSSDGEDLVLYAHIKSRVGPALDLWRVFMVMAVSTLLLLAVLYSLLLRLIVKPVERLAKLSHSTALARGMIPTLAHTERKDEIGELVRSFNKMAAEVNDLRLNLEKRVRAATQELEQAQQQLVVGERLSAAGRMAAGVAHEVNNPLGGMINAARTLRARAAPGRDSEYLDLILDGLGRIQAIVASMLQFSRPAQQPGSVDLREVLDGALMFCRYRTQGASMNVVKNYEIAGASPFNVVANRAELGQVFLNLIVNALDAMESKHESDRKLTLGLSREGASIVTRVADTGAGMKPEVKERAGQFFYTTKAEGKGTGLGLAVVQHIVMKHQGTMSIDSTEGAGTTVTVTLPAEG